MPDPGNIGSASLVALPCPGTTLLQAPGPYSFLGRAKGPWEIDHRAEAGLLGTTVPPF